MSNANRDYAIVYDIKNSSLILSRPLIFYITDKNTSNIFVKLVTRITVGDGIDQYTDIENASNYVLTMRVIKPNNEVKSIQATQHEPESIFQFDLTEDFEDVPGKYICELIISTIVNKRQELITSDPFNYEVKQSILSNVGEVIETKDTTVEKLLNNLDATKLELSSQIKEKASNIDLAIERARIDSIVLLPEGSTTGDAELIDARIGANGVRYSNAGDSIRGQFRLLNKQAQFLEELGCKQLLIDNSDFEWGTRMTGIHETSGDYGKLKSNKKSIPIQDIYVEVTNCDTTNLICTIGVYNSDGSFINFVLGNAPMTNGRMTVTRERIISELPSAINSYIYVNIGVFDGTNYIKLNDNAIINVYKPSSQNDNIFNAIDKITLGDIIQNNSDFIYGAYLDNTGYKNTDMYGYLKVCSDFIEVKQNLKLLLDNCDDYYNYFYCCALFDGKGNFINLFGDSTQQNMYFASNSIEIDINTILGYPGVKYMRVNIAKVSTPLSSDYIRIPNAVKIRLIGDSGISLNQLNERINHIDKCDYKNISIIGDSITYGFGLGDIENQRYSTLLSKSLGTKINNYGVSGSKISEIDGDSIPSFIDRITSIDSTSDLIVLFGGTNDYWHNQTQIGDINSTDTSTLCGALNYIINYLQTNFLGKDYLFIFPFNQYYNGVNTDTVNNAGSFNDFRKAFIQVCENKGVPVLDLYSNSGMDIAHNETVRNYYTQDGVHPNAVGHKRLARLIENKIKQM